MAHLLDLTGGQGVDAVVETIGGDNLDQSLQALKVKGHVALIGLIKGVVTPVDTLMLLFKQATIVDMEVGNIEDLLAIYQAIEAYDIHPVVDRVFLVAQAKEVMQFLASGSHFGKSRPYVLVFRAIFKPAHARIL
jgi:NADPH:quinone reductase-like Zn-dependent oxidoreductase